MLLSAAARYMETARECMNASDIEGRFNATEKCSTILSGLRSCLNRETPEAQAISDTLDSYYARLLTFMTQINIKNDLALCESVIESLRTMSSTWREVQMRADEANRSTPVERPAANSSTDTQGGDSNQSSGGFSGVSA